MAPAKSEIDPSRYVHDTASVASVYAEQIRLLYQSDKLAPLNVLIAGLATAMFWSIFPAWIFGLWFGSFCVVISGRVVLHYYYGQASDCSANALGWAHRYVGGAAATGVLWGLCGSIILATSDTSYHVLSLFLIGGMMAGSMLAHSAYLPAFYGFTLPAALPALVILLTRADPRAIEMGLMLAGYIVVFAITGRNINRSIVENLRLRIEQDVILAQLRMSEAALAEAQAIACIGSWHYDALLQTISWSEETFHICGVDPGAFRPSREAFLARIHPDDRAMYDKNHCEAIAGGAPLEIDVRVVMDDGAVKDVHVSGRNFYDAAGQFTHSIGTVQDVTERKIAETRLQFANILLKAEMEASPDGILVVGPTEEIISTNQQFADMWEIPPMDLAAGQDGPVLAKVMSQIKAPESFLARVHQLYASPSETSHDEFETTDGKFIDRYTRGLSSDSGKNLGRVWFFRDITKRKQAEQLVRKMARHDGLTGLANRLVFVEALRDAIAEANRGRKSFAVIYLDLDRFKDVNDTLGHPIGDALLRSVANRLKANARETDTVARFGGDEFAVVVMDISEPADAAILAEKLLKAMSDPFSIRGNILQIGASIGIDLYGPDAPDAETLLSHADIALYRAKSEGRGVYRFFTDAMDAEVRTQVTLGAELREGVASEQFFLLYQPQVCSDSGRITGVEALIRWSHPLHGVLRPDLFMQTAEKIGLVGKLGHWALWAACRQGKAWLDAKIAPVRISVNVSALQFKAPLALEADIISALAETRLPPHLLELELTESALMVASRENSDVLVRLRRSGVTIAIDDFGTGYSSLDYLRQFPVDRIKIAQNFVTRLETMPGNAKIVKATIGLARELGIMVVAEGVETQEQLELLESWGCSEVQGFYFSKPLPPEDLAPFLRTGRMPFSKAARKVAG